ncbi:MAG: nucleotidyltransferase domain-containing protein [Candidatus Thermoplasmatota archaeon]|nr:nucleotidyltransferase domain-containing protein [Candidatus Thermoplasmatota archaeon]MBU1940670.1 nucleotidyltransferase domain-containing protein [Candidatus Thermoplasmatota archaeon]
MYLDAMFERYKDWKILRLFLQHPDQGFYTKEIARKTGIGSGTVNIFLRNILQDTILTKEIIGNVHLYKLNNDHILVKQLKTVHTLLVLEQITFIPQLLQKHDAILTVVLYGSYASGENDSKSDLDVLLLVKEKKPITVFSQQIEKKVGKNVSIQMMTSAEWRLLKDKDPIFYEAILENHIVLWGSGLP